MVIRVHLRCHAPGHGSWRIAHPYRYSHAIRWRRLTGHGFNANRARRQLRMLAYNLGNFLRRLALLPSVKQWSLTTLRSKLIKIGARVVHHARYVTFQLAEVAVSPELFVAVLERNQGFGAPPLVPGGPVSRLGEEHDDVSQETVVAAPPDV